MNSREQRRWVASQARRAGTVKFSYDSRGRPQYIAVADGTVFNNLPDAQSYAVNQSFITRTGVVSEFDRNVPPEYVEMLKDLRAQHGKKIQLEYTQFAFDDPAQIDEFVNNLRGSNNAGAIVTDGASGSLLNITSDGKRWSNVDVFNWMKRHRGYDTQVTADGNEYTVFGKAAKRDKAISTAKQYGVITDKPGSIRLTVSDNLLNLDLRGELTSLAESLMQEGTTMTSEELAKHVRTFVDATDDGQGRIGVGAIKQIADRYRQDVWKFENEMNVLREADPIANRGRISDIESAIRLLEKDIRELDGYARSGKGLLGSRFIGNNVAIESSDAEKYLAKLQKQLDDVSSSNLPGLNKETIENVILKKIREIQKAVAEGKPIGAKAHLVVDPTLGDEIVVAPSGVTLEAGFNRSAAEAIEGGGRLGDQLSLYELGKGKKSRFDIQSMSAYPDIFNRDMIDKATGQLMDRVSADMKMISEGVVPPGFLSELEDATRSADPIKQREARQILNFLESGGKINQDPNLVAKAYRFIKESMTRKANAFSDEVMPNLHVPGSLRGKIIGSRDMADDYVARGAIRWSPELQSWVVNQYDTHIMKIMGGGDYDDSVAPMLRYSASKKRWVAQTYRNPLSRGEAIELNVDLMNVLDRGNPLLDDLSDSARGKVRAHLGWMESFDDRIFEASRPGRGSTSLENLWRQRELRENAIHSIMRQEMGDVAYTPGAPNETKWRTYLDVKGDKPVTEHLSELAPENQAKALAGWMDRLRLASGSNKNLVGTLSNSTMFLDHWQASNYKALEAAGRADLLSVELIRLEDFIDQFAQGFQGAITPEQAQRLSAQSIEKVVEATLVAQYGPDQLSNVQIDRLMYGMKANKAAFERGAEAAERRLGKSLPEKWRETIFMSEDDPRATVTRFHGAMELIRAKEEELSQRVAYGKELFEGDRGRAAIKKQRAMRDADDFTKAYQRAVAEFGFGDENPMRRAIAAENRAEEMLSYMQRRFFVDGAISDRGYEMAAVLANRNRSDILRTLEVARGETESGLTFFGELQQWLGGGDPTRMTADDIYTTLGRVTRRGAGVDELIKEALDGSPITMRMLEDLTGSADSLGAKSTVINEALDQTSGHSIVAGADGRLRGPLDPRAVVRTSGPDGPVQTSMGDLLWEMKSASNEGDRVRTARTVRQSVESFFDVMAETAAGHGLSDMSLNEETQNELSRRAKELIEGDPARVSRVTRAAHEAGRDKKTSGATEGKARRTKFMRDAFDAIDPKTKKIGAGMAAVAAASLISTFRKKDHTINDMQGEAFRPGGNPYTDYPMAASPLEVPSYSSNSQQGVTYAVRTRGGDYDASFLDQIAGFTGGSVSGSTYDTVEPGFQSDAARERIMRSY